MSWPARPAELLLLVCASSAPPGSASLPETKGKQNAKKENGGPKVLPIEQRAREKLSFWG